MSNGGLRKYIAILVVVGATFVFFNLSSITGGAVHNDNPEEVITNLFGAIEVAKQNGDYRCCINPACTMCYLGKWKYEKGTCYCDDAIKEGKGEDVCPECKKGLDSGLCSSVEGEDCEV